MIKRTLRYTFSLLNVDHVQLTSSWNYQNIISPYYRLYYIDEGEGMISDSGAAYKLEPGYLYIIPSFTLCSMSCESSLSQYFIQFFEESATGISLFADSRHIFKLKATELDIRLFMRLLEINPGRGINRSDNPRIYEKDIYYKEYQEQNNHQSLSVFMQTQGILLLLMSNFIEINSSLTDETSIIPQKVMKIISHILLNLRQELAISELAAMANQNIDHFSRQFKLYTGLSPINYIREKRIERAQYLMATTNMSYSMISSETGFDTLSYFSRTFKKITGISPSEYKRQLYLMEFK